MALIKFFVLFTLFISVLSSEQNVKIDSFETYKKFMGYHDTLTSLNNSGTISEEYKIHLVNIKKALDVYEKENPDDVKKLQDLKSDETMESTVSKATSVAIKKIEPALCNVFLEVNDDYNIEEKLFKILKRKYIHLIKYNIRIDNKNYSELDSNSKLSNSYGMDTWFQTFTDQGKNLLSLTSDFGLKSLTLLTSGIEEVPVILFENEPNCFTQLDPKDQKFKLMELLMNSFFDKSDKDFLHEHNLCYHKIDIENSRGKFVYECCNLENECQVVENLYIGLFTMFLLIIKLIFLLLCPMIIQKLFFSKNIGKFNYSVPVPKPGLKKTMLIKRVHSDYETVHRSSKFLPGNKVMQQFSNFRKLVRSIPSDEIVSVDFSVLDVSVDHADLLSKNDSPIQFLQYIYTALIRCHCGRAHPFRTCYGESIVGSWSPNFLWCRLQKKCETNNSCRECLSWFAIFRFFSTIILIILLPLPFYAKVFYYHYYEKVILEERSKELDNYGVEEDIYQMLIKGVYKYICYLGLFLCYFLSALVFFLLRALFPSQISMIINQSVRDFKNINRFECLRMIMSHLILPFEKFGILGLVVGVFYWPIVIPISIVLTTIYCIPMLYIIGRIFILERPQCIDNSNQNSLRSHGSHSISRNVSSIANCFFLDHISPRNRIVECSVSHEKPLKKTKLLFCCSFDKTKLLSFIKNIIIGVIFITLLLSLSVMYTEAFGFLVEVVFLSVLGAFLNGRELAFYLILVLVAVLYVALYLHHIKWKYSSFSHTLFEAIKAKLHNDIMNKLARCGEMREFTAFKYFTPDELKDRTSKEYAELNNVRMRSDVERMTDQGDNIEYLSGRLHWTLNSLIIFMDGQDMIRMPKDLFWMICSLNIPSTPGPFWKTLFLSTIKLIATFVYLAVLLLIILFFSDTQSEYNRWIEEDANQPRSSFGLRVFILLLLGLLPALVYVLVQFCKCRPETAMIGESIAWIIKSYRRSWPVSDLVFENPESPKSRASEARTTRGEEAAREEEGRNEMPLKVDLLITLKDEPIYDPNRISMASNGSIQSLSSINKLSPEEGTLPLNHSDLLVNNNTVQLQRPLLASNIHDNASRDSEHIELKETTKKLEYHVA